VRGASQPVERVEVCGNERVHALTQPRSRSGGALASSLSVK